MDEPLPLDTGTRAEGEIPLAEVNPVARVLIDHPVPHLAREFDYAVPKKFADKARAGVRVRVKFAGKLRDGFVIARTTQSDHVGPLAAIARITSPVEILTPGLLELCRSVADRYGGTLPDVLRLAIPARHAAAEKAVLAQAKDQAAEDEQAKDHPAVDKQVEDQQADDQRAVDQPADPGTEIDRLGAWVAEMSAATVSETEPGVIDGDKDGPPTDHQEPETSEEHPPRREAKAIIPGDVPGLDWISAGLRAARETMAAGHSVLWLVPDYRELSVLASALEHAGIPDREILSADQSPAERWTTWLRARLGRARIVIGTRAAAFVPLPDLGLIICLEDSSTHYLDQHAPYPHAREVCLLRSTQENTGMMFLSTDRSPEIQRLVDIGWLQETSPARAARRSGAPLVFVPDEDRDIDAGQRIPSRAFDLMRNALNPRTSSRTAGDQAAGATAHTPGPVLIQVPRSGYYPVFACARCHEVARCPRCQSTLSTQSEVGPFACKHCSYRSETFTCSRCRSHQVRSIVRGRGRTTEELRRALPGVEILESGGDSIPIALDDSPRIVVATTGAEPYARGGYACAILLDSLWPGPWLRATDEGVTRRMRAASLVRSRDQGGTIFLGDTDELIRHTMLTFDPVAYMSRQLQDRAALGFPPYRRIVELTGPGSAIDEVVSAIPDLVELIRDDLDNSVGPNSGQGPSTGDGQKVVCAFEIGAGTRVGPELAAITASRSAKKLPLVRVRVDDPRSL